MTLTYKLDQNDYLQHQLFLSSQIPRLKKQRTNSWLMLSGSVLVFSHISYLENTAFLSYFFLAFGVILLLFYPPYERQLHKAEYNKLIEDIYKNRFGQPVNITLSESAIEISDNTGEAKINLTAIENVTETGNYFFPKLKAGDFLIIPKSKLSDVDMVRNELLQICGKLNIGFIEDLNWKWK